MDVREMGSVRWVLKGRDGAWRRSVVRDEEEMMMGCCVREMAASGAWGLPPDLGNVLRMGFWKTMLEEALRRVLHMGGFVFWMGLGVLN